MTSQLPSALRFAILGRAHVNEDLDDSNQVEVDIPSRSSKTLVEAASTLQALVSSLATIKSSVPDRSTPAGGGLSSEHPVPCDAAQAKDGYVSRQSANPLSRMRTGSSHAPQPYEGGPPSSLSSATAPKHSMLRPPPIQVPSAHGTAPHSSSRYQRGMSYSSVPTSPPPTGSPPVAHSPLTAPVTPTSAAPTSAPQRIPGDSLPRSTQDPSTAQRRADNSTVAGPPGYSPAAPRSFAARRHAQSMDKLRSSSAPPARSFRAAAHSAAQAARLPRQAPGLIAATPPHSLAAQRRSVSADRVWSTASQLEVESGVGGLALRPLTLGAGPARSLAAQRHARRSAGGAQLQGTAAQHAGQLRTSHSSRPRSGRQGGREGQRQAGREDVGWPGQGWPLGAGQRGVGVGLREGAGAPWQSGEVTAGRAGGQPRSLAAKQRAEQRASMAQPRSWAAARRQEWQGVGQSLQLASPRGVVALPARPAAPPEPAALLAEASLQERDIGAHRPTGGPAADSRAAAGAPAQAHWQPSQVHAGWQAAAPLVSADLDRLGGDMVASGSAVVADAPSRALKAAARAGAQGGAAAAAAAAAAGHAATQPLGQLAAPSRSLPLAVQHSQGSGAWQQEAAATQLPTDALQAPGRPGIATGSVQASLAPAAAREQRTVLVSGPSSSPGTGGLPAPSWTPHALPMRPTPLATHQILLPTPNLPSAQTAGGGHSRPSTKSGAGAGGSGSCAGVGGGEGVQASAGMRPTAFKAKAWDAGASRSSNDGDAENTEWSAQSPQLARSGRCEPSSQVGGASLTRSPPRGVSLQLGQRRPRSATPEITPAPASAAGDVTDGHRAAGVTEPSQRIRRTGSGPSDRSGQTRLPSDARPGPSPITWAASNGKATAGPSPDAHGSGWRWQSVALPEGVTSFQAGRGPNASDGQDVVHIQHGWQGKQGLAGDLTGPLRPSSPDAGTAVATQQAGGGGGGTQPQPQLNAAPVIGANITTLHGSSSRSPHRTLTIALDNCRPVQALSPLRAGSAMDVVAGRVRVACQPPPVPDRGYWVKGGKRMVPPPHELLAGASVLPIAWSPNPQLHSQLPQAHQQPPSGLLLEPAIDPSGQPPLLQLDRANPAARGSAWLQTSGLGAPPLTPSHEGQQPLPQPTSFSLQQQAIALQLRQLQLQQEAVALQLQQLQQQQDRRLWLADQPDSTADGHGFVPPSAPAAAAATVGAGQVDGKLVDDQTMVNYFNDPQTIALAARSSPTRRSQPPHSTAAGGASGQAGAGRNRTPDLGISAPGLAHTAISSPGPGKYLQRGPDQSSGWPGAIPGTGRDGGDDDDGSSLRSEDTVDALLLRPDDPLLALDLNRLLHQQQPQQPGINQPVRTLCDATAAKGRHVRLLKPGELRPTQRDGRQDGRQAGNDENEPPEAHNAERPAPAGAADLAKTAQATSPHLSRPAPAALPIHKIRILAPAPGPNTLPPRTADPRPRPSPSPSLPLRLAGPPHSGPPAKAQGGDLDPSSVKLLRVDRAQLLGAGGHRLLHAMPRPGGGSAWSGSAHPHQTLRSGQLPEERAGTGAAETTRPQPWAEPDAPVQPGLGGGGVGGWVSAGEGGEQQGRDPAPLDARWQAGLSTAWGLEVEGHAAAVGRRPLFPGAPSYMSDVDLQQAQRVRQSGPAHTTGSHTAQRTQHLLGLLQTRQGGVAVVPDAAAIIRVHPSPANPSELLPHQNKPSSAADFIPMTANGLRPLPPAFALSKLGRPPASSDQDASHAHQPPPTSSHRTQRFVNSGTERLQSGDEESGGGRGAGAYGELPFELSALSALTALTALASLGVNASIQQARTNSHAGGDDDPSLWTSLDETTPASLVPVGGVPAHTWLTKKLDEADLAHAAGLVPRLVLDYSRGDAAPLPAAQGAAGMGLRHNHLSDPPSHPCPVCSPPQATTMEQGPGPASSPATSASPSGLTTAGAGGWLPGASQASGFSQQGSGTHGSGPQGLSTQGVGTESLSRQGAVPSTFAGWLPCYTGSPLLTSHHAAADTDPVLAPASTPVPSTSTADATAPSFATMGVARLAAVAAAAGGSSPVSTGLSQGQGTGIAVGHPPASSGPDDARQLEQSGDSASASASAAAAAAASKALNITFATHLAEPPAEHTASLTFRTSTTPPPAPQAVTAAAAAGTAGSHNAAASGAAASLQGSDLIASGSLTASVNQPDTGSLRPYLPASASGPPAHPATPGATHVSGPGLDAAPLEPAAQEPELTGTLAQVPALPSLPSSRFALPSLPHAVPATHTTHTAAASQLDAHLAQPAAGPTTLTASNPVPADDMGMRQAQQLLGAMSMHISNTPRSPVSAESSASSPKHESLTQPAEPLGLAGSASDGVAGPGVSSVIAMDLILHSRDIEDRAKATVQAWQAQRAKAAAASRLAAAEAMVKASLAIAPRPVSKGSEEDTAATSSVEPLPQASQTAQSATLDLSMPPRALITAATAAATATIAALTGQHVRQLVSSTNDPATAAASRATDTSATQQQQQQQQQDKRSMGDPATAGPAALLLPPGLTSDTLTSQLVNALSHALGLASLAPASPVSALALPNRQTASPAGEAAGGASGSGSTGTPPDSKGPGLHAPPCGRDATAGQTPSQPPGHASLATALHLAAAHSPASLSPQRPIHIFCSHLTLQPPSTTSTAAPNALAHSLPDVGYAVVVARPEAEGTNAPAAEGPADQAAAAAASATPSPPLPSATGAVVDSLKHSAAPLAAQEPPVQVREVLSEQQVQPTEPELVGPTPPPATDSSGGGPQHGKAALAHELLALILRAYDHPDPASAQGTATGLAHPDPGNQPGDRSSVRSEAEGQAARAPPQACTAPPGTLPLQADEAGAGHRGGPEGRPQLPHPAPPLPSVLPNPTVPRGQGPSFLQVLDLLPQAPPPDPPPPPMPWQPPPQPGQQGQLLSLPQDASLHSLPRGTAPDTHAAARLAQLRTRMQQQLHAVTGSVSVPGQADLHSPPSAVASQATSAGRIPPRHQVVEGGRQAVQQLLARLPPSTVRALPVAEHPDPHPAEPRAAASPIPEIEVASTQFQVLGGKGVENKWRRAELSTWAVEVNAMSQAVARAELANQVAAASADHARAAHESVRLGHVEGVLAALAEADKAARAVEEETHDTLRFMEDLEEAADASAARHLNNLMMEARQLTAQVETLLAMSDQS